MEQEQRTASPVAEGNTDSPVTFKELREAGIRSSDLRDVAWAELATMTLAQLRKRLAAR